MGGGGRGGGESPGRGEGEERGEEGREVSCGRHAKGGGGWGGSQDGPPAMGIRSSVGTGNSTTTGCPFRRAPLYQGMVLMLNQILLHTVLSVC